MAVTPRIFVSATTDDLQSPRAAVAAALRKLECHAVVQGDWPPDYRTVEAMLRRRIKDCDAVIHLAGLRYGAEPRPPSRPPAPLLHPDGVSHRPRVEETPSRSC